MWMTFGRENSILTGEESTLYSLHGGCQQKMSVGHAELTRRRCWNCTVVGFSKKFLIFGDMARMSSGIHLPAILGNELYTRPASRPATNAPKNGEQVQNKYTCGQQLHLQKVTWGLLFVPDSAVINTMATVPWARPLNLFKWGLAAFKEGKEWDCSFASQTINKGKRGERVGVGMVVVYIYIYIYMQHTWSVGGERIPRAVYSIEEYMTSAVPRWAARRYWLTRGMSVDAEMSLRPLFTIHQPRTPYRNYVSINGNGLVGFGLSSPGNQSALRTHQRALSKA